MSTAVILEENIIQYSKSRFKQRINRLEQRPRLQLQTRVAVLIPCYNEGVTIRKTILGVKEALPDALIYVYDNASEDNTVAEASCFEDVIVRHEPKRGKGNVVRRMFNEVDADVYIMIDGDATYDVSNAAEMVKTLRAKDLAMINVARISTSKSNYRTGRKLGNIMLNKIVGLLLHHNVKDMLSGYKVFSRNFVKNFPCKSQGFDLETEMLMYCAKSKSKIAEYSALYNSRPENSSSKLCFVQDGFKIMFCLLKNLLI